MSDDNDENPLLGCILFLLIIPLAIWKAWVFTILWSWFLLPLGAPMISIPIAYGLLITSSMVIGLPSDFKKEDRSKQLLNLFMAIIGPLVALGIGWITTKFM